MIPLQLQYLSRGAVLRYQRKTYRKLQQQVGDVWEKLNTGDISAKELLRLCSNLYGPKITVVQ